MKIIYLNNLKPKYIVSHYIFAITTFFLIFITKETYLNTIKTFLKQIKSRLISCTWKIKV